MLFTVTSAAEHADAFFLFIIIIIMYNNNERFMLRHVVWSAEVGGGLPVCRSEFGVWCEFCSVV